MEVILTRGLPASGKSTWAKEIASVTGYRRWNNDEFSYMVTGVAGPKSFHHMDGEFLGVMRKQFIRRSLARGVSVILDNTNLNPNAFVEAEQIAREFAITPQFRDFPATLRTCLIRDRRRGEFSVGEKVIRGMFEKFGHHYDWLKEQ